MVRLTAILIAAAVLALSISACGITFSDEGPFTRENREVPSFDRLQVRGSTDVVVRPAPGGVLTVEGGRNRVEDLVTRVESGTLVVEGPDYGIDLSDGQATAIVRAPSLSEVRVDGSGDVTLAGLRGGELEVEVNGSGDVRAAGRLTSLEAELEGSGDLDFRDLSVDSAALEISGSGDADLDARQRLDVELRGSGDVSYSGDPLVTEDVDGSGSVQRG
jgi:hypothetical protein